MKFFAIAATFVAAVAAGSYDTETCKVVTVTVTEHAPSAPAVHYSTGSVVYPDTSAAPYPVPSSAAPYPIPSGTGAPLYPIPSGTGAPHPTGTGGVYPTAPAEFTGAASPLQVGGFVAGVGAFAAFFL